MFYARAGATGDDEPLDPAASLAAITAAQQRIDARIRADLDRRAAPPSRPVNAAIIAAATSIFIGSLGRWPWAALVATGAFLGFALVAKRHADDRIGVRRRPRTSGREWAVHTVGITVMAIVLDNVTPEQQWWLGIGLSPIAAALGYVLARRQARRRARA